ncbi:large ribosomal subunit protein mL65 [Paroedura picta]|uniref:large ribosomal subunit protein mL65 n=1 Tax=Paroedura picta TaxID=143630 RepID=UPI00405780A9
MAAVRLRRLLCNGRLVHSAASEAETTPATPPPSLYPPVVASHTAKSLAAKRRRREMFFQSIHDAPTVEKKLRIYTKLQRLKYVVYPQTWALNAYRWYQDYTKTVFVPELPVVEEAEAAARGVDLAELRSVVCDLLLQEYFYQRKKKPLLFGAAERGPSPFLTLLLPVLTTHLMAHNPILAYAFTDFKPEVNFYWKRGEVVVPYGHRKGTIDPVLFQIDDKPHCQLRIPKQLPEFAPLDYVAHGEIPVIQVLPDKLPLFKRQYDNNIFIGSKLADPCTYGHTQFHLIPDKVKRERLIRLGNADQIEVPYRNNGLASLFAWTGAQAMYQGFWSEADVTRPFVSQAVVSDGRHFAFFCYQLNTLALTVEADKDNSRKNICWGIESKPLYEAIEGSDVKGFDDEVLLQLVKFLLNRPK